MFDHKTTKEVSNKLKNHSAPRFFQTLESITKGGTICSAVLFIMTWCVHQHCIRGTHMGDGFWSKSQFTVDLHCNKLLWKNTLAQIQQVPYLSHPASQFLLKCWQTSMRLPCVVPRTDAHVSCWRICGGTKQHACNRLGQPRMNESRAHTKDVFNHIDNELCNCWQVM